jgi:hypothetical protein
VPIVGKKHACGSTHPPLPSHWGPSRVLPPPPSPRYATAADRSGDARGDVGPPLRAMSSPYVRGEGAPPCSP